ncbi:helix-turn-helix transcriptional regulator [Vibrio cyclitrophicus]|uniref:helix-turn-helix transcriptional regulator n=1 Tax=Vibrio cyclitrophicus TaxID=47951 RepID=UPI0009BDEC2C|nr:AlpA family phage regulatory protein [Vibrio cyclitrophicus]
MNQQQLTPLLLRRKQVCQALNISPSTLDRLRQNPNARFPSGIYTGNKILGWRLKDIHNWLNNQ